MKSSFNQLSAEGINLTIAILSFDSSDVTINLLRSILKHEQSAQFKILVLNQGSSIEETQKIEQAESNFQAEVITIEKNLGIPSGRDKLLQLCQTDWILFLDNDLLFQDSFLRELSEATRSNHEFVSLAFYEGSEYKPELAAKPTLYLSTDSKNQEWAGLGGISVLQEPDFSNERPGIAGGVFLANTGKLREIGGFNCPGMVGYEDLELTLRAYKANMRIAHALAEKPVFHFKSTENSSKQKTNRLKRLDPLELRVNARFIEQQHDVKVWNFSQHLWVYESLKAFGLQDELPARVNPFLSQKAKGSTQPMVLIVADQPGWALDRIAQQMKKHLSQDFNLVVVYSINWAELAAVLNFAVWDAVLFLWRNPLFLLIREGLISEPTLKRTSFIVYDHQGWMGFEEEANFFIDMKTPIGAVNEKLTKDLKSQLFNVVTVPDGIDQNLFYPANNSKSSDKIRIGWAGNSQWGGVDDNKGFNKVIKPLMKAMDPKVFEFCILDASKGKLPQRAVAGAMRTWDILICTSAHEGTPNPILEGMATGLHLVSTRVGMIPELNRSGATIVTVPRTHLDFANAIEDYWKAEAYRYPLETENYQASQEWGWKKVIQNHKKLVELILMC